MRQNYSIQNQNKMLQDHMISIKTTFMQLGFSTDKITTNKKSSSILIY